MVVYLHSLSSVTIFIVWASIIQFNLGGAIFYDLPSVLGVQLVKDVGLTPAQVQFLTTIYAIPNLVLPMFQGSFMDLFGLEISLFLGNIVNGTSFIGFAYGVYIKNWHAILFSRLLFALSAEFCIISQYVITNNIIPKKYVSQFFAFISFIESMSIFLNSLLSTQIYDKVGSIGDAFFYITLIEQISVVQGFALIAIRYTHDLNFYSAEKNNEPIKEDKADYNMKNIFKFRAEFFYLQGPQIILCGITYTFTNVSIGMFQNIFNLTITEAGYINSSLGILAIFINPIVGYYTKQYNKKAIIAVLGALIQISGIICILLLQNLKISYINQEWLFVLGIHIKTFFGNTQACLLFTTCLVGSGFSIFSCIRNEMVFSVVPAEYHGLAMGTMSLSSSIGIGCCSFLIEIINQNATKESYFEVQVLYLLGLLTGLVFILLNLFHNYATDGCHFYSQSHFDKLSKVGEHDTKEKTKKLK